MYTLYFTKQAQKDAKKISKNGLRENVENLLAIISNNPFKNPPPYEKLVGDLAGAYSRRITYQHRLIYQVDRQLHRIKIIRMSTHFE